MKKVFSCLLILSILLMLSGCHQHDFAQTKTIKRVTCTEDGEYEYTCKECQKVEYRKVKAAGHHDWEPANCQAPKTCKKCRTTEGGKGDHIFNDNGECKYCYKKYKIAIDDVSRGKGLQIAFGVDADYYPTNYQAYINDLDCKFSNNSVTINIKGYVDRIGSDPYYSSDTFKFFVLLRNYNIRMPSNSEYWVFTEYELVSVKGLKEGDTFERSVTFPLENIDNHSEDYTLDFVCLDSQYDILFDGFNN